VEPIETIFTARRQGERGAWSAAVVLTLLLHALVLGGIWVLRPFSPDLVQAQPPPPIELVFADAPKPRDEPSEFTELPEDRADTPPEKADFLSNVDSRARDESPATGESRLPRLEGASDAPHVALVPGETAQEPSAPSPETQEPPDPAEFAAGSLSRTRPAPRPREVPPSPDPRLLLMRPGNSDIFQESLLNPEGETPLYGGISLNTMAWDYAPWLQKFVRDFLRDWRAPYAYHMGLIDGWHVLELEIDPGGRLLRLDVREKEGSDALVQNSKLTLRALAPYQPLPESFPDKSLILRFKLTYSKATRPTR
jgi:hypothetical protein